MQKRTFTLRRLLSKRVARSRLFAHTTDYTHGKTVLRLAGVSAGRLLSKICGLDFYDMAFPDRHVAQTSAAKIKTLVARRDEEDTPVWSVFLEDCLERRAGIWK